MSDFDKEAERERLRKKYERDQKKRETTQRMSELLLKGATMTNRHCEVCGDPIFRYEGQEFCPSCQQKRPAEGADDGSTAADTQIEADAEPGGADEADARGIDATGGADGASRTVDSAEPADAGDAAEPAESSPPETTGGATAAGADGAERRPRDANAEVAPDPEAGARIAPSTPAAGTEGVDGDLRAARASLVRTLDRLAREAESAGDPRRTREYLAAAREAAEAVAALDR